MMVSAAFVWWFASIPAHSLAVPPDAGAGVAAIEPQAAPEERVKPKLVTPAIVAAAESYLSGAYHDPVGSESYADVDGRRFVFVLEWHYHPPGYIGAPTGWHKGVTVYEVR
jgi:hypothetical protein